MGKTGDVFMKISDTNRIFYAKMDTVKERTGIDLTQVEDIKKRWQEYTEELFKKDHDPDNRNGVVTPPTARHPGV